MVQTTYTQGISAIDKTREADNKYQLNTIDGNKGWTLMSEMGRQVLFEDEFDIIGGATTDIPLNDIAHIPNINVFTSLNPWTFVNPTNIWQISHVNLYAYALSGNAVALMDAMVNCELKMVVELNSPGSGSHCGIEFRHDTTLNFWRFSIENDSGIFYARLYKGTSQKFTTSALTIPDSKTFVLKVKLSNSFISIFLNDLLLNTTNDASYIGAIKHGMRSNSDKYHVHSFKIIK